MRRFVWILAAFLAIPGAAAAQQQTSPPDPGQGTLDVPRWDLNASAGLFQGRPNDESEGWDHWYGDGRYTASLGYYWTTHFKTEVEFATTGEGQRYTQEYVDIPGLPTPYPISTDVFHQVRQTSARAVWQFGDNVWVHPYLNAGIVYEMERTRYRSPEQFYYPPGDPRMPIRPQLTGERESDRVGFTIGGGSKFYVSPNAYIHAGLQITRAKPSTSVTALAGIGIEF